MSVEIEKDELLEGLKETNSLLKTKNNAYKAQILDLEKKVDYLSKIILLYENIIKFGKEEAKELKKEYDGNVSSLKKALQTLKTSYAKVKTTKEDKKESEVNALRKIIETAILKVEDMPKKKTSAQEASKK